MNEECEVLEMARFAMVGGSTEVLRGAAQRIETWLRMQPGFRSRTLVGPDEQGRFTDLVRWRRHEDAVGAGRRFMESECAREFLALVQKDSVEMCCAPVVMEA